MKYEDMSDNQINKLIVELMHDPSEPYCILHNGVWHKSIGHIIGRYPDGAFKFVNDERWWIPFPNYCNNPSDAWPIMNDARIEIKRDTCQAHVSSYFNPEFVIHCRNDEKETLRAAMICFLKMKDSQ